MGHNELSLLALTIPVATEADEDVVDAAEERLHATLSLTAVQREEGSTGRVEQERPVLAGCPKRSPRPALFQHTHVQCACMCDSEKNTSPLRKARVPPNAHGRFRESL